MVHVRRAAAAAVSATLGAAVVTIAIDGAHVAPQATPSPALSPSAMDSFMPASIERPTGARPVSARQAPARPPATQAVVASRTHPTLPTRRAAAVTQPTAAVTQPTADPVRTGMAIGAIGTVGGRRVEPTAVTRPTAGTRPTAVTQPTARRRPAAASIGELAAFSSVPRQR